MACPRPNLLLSLGILAALAPAQERSPLVYSTFFGDAQPVAIEADGQGSAWVFGWTRSEGLPTTPNALQPERNPKICLSIGFHSSSVFPCGDLFVAKMNPEGRAFDYFTYLGGDSSDSAVDMALDADGAAYLLAVTGGELPTTPETLAPSKGASNIWIAKLEPSGSIAWATYLGGIAGSPRAMDVAPDGTIWLAGAILSANLPVTPNAVQGGFGDPLGDSRGDAFLARLSADGSRLLYASYLGGSREEEIRDLAVAPDGSVQITGVTGSRDFPVTLGAVQTVFPAGNDKTTPFVAKLSAEGSDLVYATYLGGSDSDEASSIVAASDGSAIVAGRRLSGDFPLTPGALETGGEGFLARLSPEGELIYAADIGGIEANVDVDSDGNVYLTASALLESARVSQNALQPCSFSWPGGSYVGVAAKIDPSGSQLLYSTFLSRPLAIDAAGDGSFFAAGSALGRELPVTNPAAPYHRDEGAYLARIDPAGTRRDLFASLIRNGASYSGGAIAPGEWISLFNLPVGPETPQIAQLDEAGRPPTELDGLRVLINGAPVLLNYAHRCQVNAIAPFGLEGADQAEIIVEYQGQRSNVVTLPVSPAAPGLFSVDATGLGAAAALNEDLSINASHNPARKGAAVALFGTGAGRMAPALEDGEAPANADSRIAGETKIFVRDATQQWIEAEVLYAGAAPGLTAGLVQVNFRIPESLIVPQSVLPPTPRPIEVKLKVDGAESEALGLWVEP